MGTKAAMITTVLTEIRKAQTDKWTPPPAVPVKQIKWPATLWLGDGRSLSATQSLLEAISEYSKLCWNNSIEIRTRYSLKEITKVLERCFASALAELELDYCDEELHQELGEHVERLFAEELERSDHPTELVLGCHVFEGSEPFPIKVGPVLFEARGPWCDRMAAAGKFSRITARRLHARWAGKTLSVRKSSMDAVAEDSIHEAIASCPVVCSVSTDGLSGKFIREKGY